MANANGDERNWEKYEDEYEHEYEYEYEYEYEEIEGQWQLLYNVY